MQWNITGAGHVLLKTRLDAGILLAERIAPQVRGPFLLLGVARGGVAVASSIARQLAIPFDVIVVKKLTSPHTPEFAVGAVAPDGVSVIHRKDAARQGMDEVQIRQTVSEGADAVNKLMLRYRKGKRPLVLTHKTVVLVDDGIATGTSLEAAIRWARKRGATSVIAAAPVSSPRAAIQLRAKADLVITLSVEETYESVSASYETFPQISDGEVVQLLRG